jgi:peptidoglycan biosynthesis protein MviN/MurJ (putative lipid II flippase)
MSISICGASFGVGGLFLAQIFSLATLVVASSFSLRHLKLRLITKAWPILRSSGMLPLFGSLLLTYLFSQLYVIAERSAMMGMSTGLLSGFQYSTALVNVMVSMVAYPLANLLWSRFLADVADGDVLVARTLAVRACGLLFYVLIVMCVFIWVNAHEIVILMFGRGAFDEASVQVTSSALRATIFTSIPISIMSILVRLLMSLPGAHRQVWISLAIIVVGLMVIGGAVFANSTHWVQLHWLIANSAGMVVSVYIFASGGRFDWKKKLAALRWVISAGMVALIAAWLTPEFALGISKSAMIAALIAQGMLYLGMVLFLTWMFRLVPILQMMFRGTR